MRKFLLGLIALLISSGSGCRSFMQGVAEEPYRKAMIDGHMSPSEYQQQKEDIRNASETTK